MAGSATTANRSLSLSKRSGASPSGHFDRLSDRRAQKKGVPTSDDVGTPRSTAATYSPNWCVSTIGARGLNCSVRYGKRWDPAAKATAIYYLRDHNQGTTSRSHGRFRAISTGRLSASRHLHLPPIDVVVYDDPLRKSHLGDGFALRCFQRLS